MRPERDATEPRQDELDAFACDFEPGEADERNAPPLPFADEPESDDDLLDPTFFKAVPLAGPDEDDDLAPFLEEDDDRHDDDEDEMALLHELGIELDDEVLAPALAFGPTDEEACDDDLAA